MFTGVTAPISYLLLCELENEEGWCQVLEQFLLANNNYHQTTKYNYWHWPNFLDLGCKLCQELSWHQSGLGTWLTVYCRTRAARWRLRSLVPPLELYFTACDDFLRSPVEGRLNTTWKRRLVPIVLSSVISKSLISVGVVFAVLWIMLAEILSISRLVITLAGSHCQFHQQQWRSG